MMCQQEGWEVARWRTVTPNLWTLLQIRALFVRPRMGVPNPLWFPMEARVSKHAGGSPQGYGAIIGVLGRGVRLIARWLGGSCIAVVNRLVDAVGMGDSLVVFIKPAY